MITDEEYLDKHVKKAERELRKAAFPYSRIKFVDIDRINFIIEEGSGELGYFKEGKCRHTIMVKDAFFRDKFKRKYNRRLISTLQHEMIHAYVCDWINNYELRMHVDSSPAFASIAVWFNNHSKDKLYIGQNNNLENDFKIFNKELYGFSINTNTSFNMLMKKLYRWEKELYYRLEKFRQRILDDTKYNNVIQSCKFSFNCDSELETRGTSTYTKLCDKKDIIVEINHIKLGMDINLYEIKEDFKLEDIIDYANDANGYKYLTNKLEDVA